MTDSVLSPELRGLIKVEKLGEEARRFVESNLGKSVEARAQAEMFAAIQELIEADPFDPKAIAALQARYNVAAAALSWIVQAIGAGQAASDALDAAQGTD